MTKHQSDSKRSNENLNLNFYRIKSIERAHLKKHRSQLRKLIIVLNALSLIIGFMVLIPFGQAFKNLNPQKSRKT